MVCGGVRGASAHSLNHLWPPLPESIQAGLKSPPTAAGIVCSTLGCSACWGTATEEISIHSLVIRFHLFVRCSAANGRWDSMRFGVGAVPQPDVRTVARRFGGCLGPRSVCWSAPGDAFTDATVERDARKQ